MISPSRVPARRRAATLRPRQARHLSPRIRALHLTRPSLLAAVGIVVGGLTLGTTLARQPAGSPSTAETDPTAAGMIQLVDHGQLAPGLAEVRLNFATTVSPAMGANRLLALAPDGATAAVASQVGPAPATLSLAHRDGSQQRVSLPGLIGAGFAPDSSWLAVIDGAGAIWRVPSAGTAAGRLADGPFIGSPIVEDGGSVIALRVSSIEAPIVSRLVRVGPDGRIVALVGDELVYGAHLMADGSIAYAAHQGSHTLLKELVGGTPRLLADLGEDAVNVTVDADAAAVAFERSGQVLVRRLADREEIPLGPGMRPEFAPDGRSVLVELASGSALIAVDGQRLASFNSQAAFAACAARCRP